MHNAQRYPYLAHMSELLSEFQIIFPSLGWEGLPTQPFLAEGSFPEVARLLKESMPFSPLPRPSLKEKFQDAPNEEGAGTQTT